jgi:hypothetical protein
VDAIDRAEDRDRFDEVCRKIGARTPANGIATERGAGHEGGRRIGYPVLVRPSYVLGGRAMEIVYDEESLKRYFDEAVQASPDHPVLIDRFLEDAFEADVDALSDGTDVVIGGIMQHIEDAGVHSGDSACVLPPYLLSPESLDEIRDLTRKFALELGVVGLLNVQYAIKDGVVYVLEVNPRASRTVPFVSKATGVPLARLAARVMAGERLADLDVPAEPPVPGVAVKEAASRSTASTWTRSSVRRCAPPARSWASTSRSAWRSRRRRSRRATAAGVGSAHRHGERARQGGRSRRSSAASTTWASRSSRRGARRSTCGARHPVPSSSSRSARGGRTSSTTSSAARSSSSSTRRSARSRSTTTTRCAARSPMADHDEATSRTTRSRDARAMSARSRSASRRSRLASDGAAWAR